MRIEDISDNQGRDIMSLINFDDGSYIISLYCAEKDERCYPVLSESFDENYFGEDIGSVDIEPVEGGFLLILKDLTADDGTRIPVKEIMIPCYSEQYGHEYSELEITYNDADGNAIKGIVIDQCEKLGKKMKIENYGEHYVQFGDGSYIEDSYDCYSPYCDVKNWSAYEETLSVQYHGEEFYNVDIQEGHEGFLLLLHGVEQFEQFDEPMKIFIPCYSDQNGYYSTNVHVRLYDPRRKLIKEVTTDGRMIR